MVGELIMNRYQASSSNSKICRENKCDCIDDPYFDFQ